MQLIQGDNRAILPTLLASSIDLTVTSPPYDNLRTCYDTLTWDAFTSLSKELYRVTKQGGVLVWVVGDATINGSETGTSFKQAIYFKEEGFNLHDTMIYQKPGIAFPDTNRYYQSFEYMFVFTKGRSKTFNAIKDRINKHAGGTVHGPERLRDGNMVPRACKGNIIKQTGVRFNVWKISNGSHKSKGHPSPFPEALARDHILSWSNEGDTVLDPFMGSGTTGKMACLLNRKFIGIEKELKYFAMAKAKIEHATSLFQCKLAL